jgi:hypothetical protein
MHTVEVLVFREMCCDMGEMMREKWAARKRSMRQVLFVDGCQFPRKSGVGIKPDVVTRDSRRTALNYL